MASIAFERTGDDFRVAVDGVLELAGAALPDRECCSMPESRWYEPLGTTQGSVVGNPWTCRFSGTEQLAAWTYEDENTAFVARFVLPVAVSL